MWRSTGSAWLLENIVPFPGHCVCALVKSQLYTCLCSSVPRFHFPFPCLICLGVGQCHTGTRVTARSLGVMLSMFSTRIVGHSLSFVFDTNFRMRLSVFAKALLEF